MNKKALTITIVANMTSNYSESLGNIASVQKVFRNRKVYTIRSRESLKNAIMTQSGLYEDLKTEIDGAVQKKVTEESNASNCRALEGGYMNTSGTTYIRNSSFYVTVLKKEAEGKPRKVAKIAALNKFLRIVYARIKELYDNMALAERAKTKTRSKIRAKTKVTA